MYPHTLYLNPHNAQLKCPFQLLSYPLCVNHLFWDNEPLKAFKTNETVFIMNVGLTFVARKLMLSFPRKPLVRERCRQTYSSSPAWGWICMIFAWGAPAAASYGFQTHLWPRPWQWLVSLRCFHTAVIKQVSKAFIDDLWMPCGNTLFALSWIYQLFPKPTRNIASEDTN